MTRNFSTFLYESHLITFAALKQVTYNGNFEKKENQNTKKKSYNFAPIDARE